MPTQTATPSSQDRRRDGSTNSGRYATPEAPMNPGEDLLNYVKDYARQKPEMAALMCFGVGFLVGWKLKPW